MNNPDENRDHTANNNRKILFIICIYLFLIMSSRYTPGDHSIRTTVIRDKLSHNDTIVSLTDAFNILDVGQIYQGKWKRQSKGSPDNIYLTQNEGSFRLYLQRDTSFNPLYFYRIDLQIFNGDYIDQGTLYYDIILENENFIFQRISENEAVTYYNSTAESITARYRLDDVLLTTQDGQMNITQFGFVYKIDNNQADVALTINCLNMNLQLTVKGPQNKTARTIFFAFIMLFSAYMPFNAILVILKSIYELQDNPRKYSLITIMLTNMWDTVLCIVCFIFSFKDQQSLMMFIIPAFLLCLLFTNLQPRFLIAIYQNLADNNFNIRQIICRFNLIHYGSLFLIYPIIILSNFNWVFFIAMSCIIFPQIYVNAFINIRPQICSSYYIKYLLSRFVLLFYLKCFPYNIFNFKPDYVLGVVCLLLICLQYGLLYAQKLYGSKKILPSFLLDPVFNYKLQEEINIEQNFDLTECSICLTSLHSDPPQNPNELEVQPAFKLMKTPCNHKYHSHCLMVWMKIKMECPQCRFKLPPYE